jgi:serine/threonine protein kinase
VFDLGEADGSYFIAMEYVDGPHLGRLARDSWRAGLPPPIVLGVYIVHRAADGLHSAHEMRDPETGEPMGIVHRDVTPHNILLSRFGDVRVADFGVAKAAGQTEHTRTGVIKGKLAQLPPAPNTRETPPAVAELPDPDLEATELDVPSGPRDPRFLLTELESDDGGTGGAPGMTLSIHGRAREIVEPSGVSLNTPALSRLKTKPAAHGNALCGARLEPRGDRAPLR